MIYEHFESYVRCLNLKKGQEMEKFQLGFKTKKYVINLAQACGTKKV